jgi:hypothetical protein
MSTRQVLKQLKYEIDKLEWTAGNPVFFDSIISTLGWEFFIDSDLRTPYVIFNTTSSNSDQENPQLKDLSITISIVTRHEGDSFGNLSAVGGHGSWTQTDSKNKGIFEISEKLWESLSSTSRKNSIFYSMAGKTERLISGTGTEQEEVLSILQIDFEAKIFERSFWESASNLQGVKNVNDVDLTWVDPPESYSLIQTGGILIARKLGSQPAITDQIATANFGDQAYTDVNPGSGTWWYGIFVNYDEINIPATTKTNSSTGIFVKVIV